MELGKSPPFLSFSFLPDCVGVIALPAVTTSEVCKGEKGHEHREHFYKVGVDGRVMAPQRCPHPNLQSL